MNEYRPTEYVVDFGDCRSNRFVGLNMTLIKQNGAKLHERIVRCRDCIHYKPYRTHQHGMMNRCHDEHGHTHKRDETDFCSRGEKASNFTTCKCGEDIETNGRESVTCPSCGRVITE